MSRLSRWTLLRVFSVCAVVAAVGACVISVLIAAALHHHESFQWVVRVATARYSPDGVISPRGLALIRRTLELLMWTSGAAAVALWLTARLLQQVVRSPHLRESFSALPPAAEHPEERWWSRNSYGVVALVLLVGGAAIRIPRLFSSLFYDEIFSIQHFATLPFVRIPFAQEGFNNHILNSLLLHVTLPASSAEALLRLPVYAAGVASLWLLFQLGRYLGGSMAGLLALWLCAVSPYHLFYSTLARGYIIALCLTLLGLWVLVTATQPPRKRSLWMFGVTQVLASWAMPTVTIVPVVIAMVLLLAIFERGRQFFGIDSCTMTGSAWLVTVLCTLTVIGVASLPMVPYLVRVQAEGNVLGGSWRGANWLGVLQKGWLPVSVGIGILGVGMKTLLQEERAAANWKTRLLLVMFACSLFIMLLSASPARIHVVAFASSVLLAAVGVRSLIVWLAGIVPAPWARARTGGVILALTLVGFSMTSWPQLTAAARGVPTQDVRGAVAIAESVLPTRGVIVTSGFAAREITYYATRRVQWLSPTSEAQTVLNSRQPYCYFRLNAEGADDPILNRVRAMGPPSVVVPGTDDRIALWCFSDGAAVRHAS